MGKKTKKVGIAGKFGAKYGKRVRDAYRDVMQKQTARYKCPRCGKKKVKRVSYAIWECTSCGYKFAGGAYTPSTEIGKAALRIVGAHMRGVEAVAEIEKAEEKEGE